MKLKPLLTMLAVIVMVISGKSFLLQNDSSSESTATTTKQVNPSATPEPSSNRALNLNEKFIAAAGLYVQIPEDMSFREDSDNDIAKGFYIEKGIQEDPTYMLYGLYQLNKRTSNEDLEMVKLEMDPATVKEVEIEGYKGIEGLITGPKGRYITLLIKDGKLLTLSTIPPTPENKEITDQILSSISFQ